MRKISFALVLLTMPACSGDKAPGKSPYFADKEILTIKGQFLDQAGAPLADTRIALRNLREFAYMDPTAVFLKNASWMMRVAFPFFPGFDQIPDTVKANYFIKNAVTNHDGTFNFQMRAEQVLRDAAGGINIILVNDGQGMGASYAKYNFVIKEATTSLDAIALCNLGETVVESAQTLDWQWTAPSFSVDHYELRIADAQDNSLLWTSRFDASTTQFSLPKSIFQASSIRYALEIFYRFDDSLQTSCLTPSKLVTIANPVPNLALHKKASGENIRFTLTSLTNGRFNDSTYLAAYDSRSVVIDFGADTLITSINLHNLQLTSDADLNLEIMAASQGTPNSFESIGLDAVTAQRFASYQLPTPKSYARLRVSAKVPISNLQEISVQ